MTTTTKRNKLPTSKHVIVEKGKCGLAVLANLTNDLRFLDFPIRTDADGNDIGHRTIQLNNYLRLLQNPFLFDTIEAEPFYNSIEPDQINWLIKKLGIKDYLKQNNLITAWLCHVLLPERDTRHAVLLLFKPSTDTYILLDSNEKEAIRKEGINPIQHLPVFELALLVDSYGSPAVLTSDHFPNLDI